jgi:DNA-binding NarL/FixJ family response regulator
VSIQIAIVEDDIELAKELAGLLALTDPDLVIQTYSDAEGCMADFGRKGFDVVLMDIGLPGISGTECIRRLKPLHPDVQFIVFTVNSDEASVFDALRAGATGYLLKGSTAKQVAEAIWEVHGGGSPMSGPIARKVTEHFALLAKPTAQGDLTKREQEILQLLSQGRRYREIARALFISVDTVRTHIRNIYQKLEVTNRTEAINRFRG